MRYLNLNKNNKNIKMLINKNTWEIDPTFIYDDDEIIELDNIILINWYKIISKTNLWERE